MTHSVMAANEIKSNLSEGRGNSHFWVQGCGCTVRCWLLYITRSLPGISLQSPNLTQVRDAPRSGQFKSEIVTGPNTLSPSLRGLLLAYAINTRCEKYIALSRAYLYLIHLGDGNIHPPSVWSHSFPLVSGRGSTSPHGPHDLEAPHSV